MWLSATRRSQASALGTLFFLVVLLMSLVTIELVASSPRESLEGAVKALREDVSNDERLEVAITDYYAAQPSYATSVTMVKGTMSARSSQCTSTCSGWRRWCQAATSTSR